MKFYRHSVPLTMTCPETFRSIYGLIPTGLPVPFLTS